MRHLRSLWCVKPTSYYCSLIPLYMTAHEAVMRTARDQAANVYSYLVGVKPDDDHKVLAVSSQVDTFYGWESPVSEP